METKSFSSGFQLLAELVTRSRTYQLMSTRHGAPLLLFGLLSVMANGVCQNSISADPAKPYFEKVHTAASKGDLKAQVCLGALYANDLAVPRDNKKAFKWYEKAALRGYPPGIEAMANAYQFGLGVPRNPTRALNSYRDLVKRGYMPAAADIGVYYMSDAWGLHKDYAKAIEWYMKAAAADDPLAQVHMAMMYKNGWGVKRDAAEAQQWLGKAVNHRIGCLADFMNLSYWIIFANLNLPGNLTDMTLSFGVNYVYHDGRAQNITVTHSSGSKDFDEAYVEALSVAHFPPWPTDYHTDDKTLGFWMVKSVPGVSPGFAARLNAIISAAMVIPLHVLIYGSKGTDISTIGFDYLNGKVSHVRIVKSSGDKYEDAAAAQAVKDAHYPPTPSAYKNRRLHFIVPMNFNPYSPPKRQSSSNLEGVPKSSSMVLPAHQSPQATTVQPLSPSARTAASGAPASSTTVGSSRPAPPSTSLEIGAAFRGVNIDNPAVPIRITSTSWNDPNYVRPLRMEAEFKNLTGETIESVWLFVSRCAAKGASRPIPYSLELRGPFKPSGVYLVQPSFPANYTEFIGPWPGIEGGRYSTHMLITKIKIEYANGSMQTHDNDVSKLLGGGISNFCSTQYH